MLVRSGVRVALGVILMLALGALVGSAGHLPGATLPTLSDSSTGDDQGAGVDASVSPAPVVAGLALVALALVALAGSSAQRARRAVLRTREPPPRWS